MVVSLTIELKSDFFYMESSYAQTSVKGYLLLNYSNNAEEVVHDIQPHDILHDSSTCIQIIGKEWIKGNKDNEDINTILIDDTYHLPTLEWQHYPEHQCFSISFDISLPHDIPVTFVGEGSGIDYLVRAHVQCLKKKSLVVEVARPLILIRGSHLLTISPSTTHSSSSSLTSSPSLSPSLTSSSSLLSSTSATPSSSSSSLLSSFFKSYPSSSASSLSTSIEGLSRLCWGMSTRTQWQYELELPQLIDASQPFSIMLRTRMRRPLTSKTSSSMESCMIGIKVYESVRAGFKTSLDQVLMTACHVLTKPSKTWSNPYVVTLELNHLPKSSTLSGSRIKVTHHLQITLDYCSAHGHSDRVYIDCIIPLTTSLVPTLSPSILGSMEGEMNTFMERLTDAKQSGKMIGPLLFCPISEFTNST